MLLDDLLDAFAPALNGLWLEQTLIISHQFIFSLAEDAPNARHASIRLLAGKPEKQIQRGTV